MSNDQDAELLSSLLREVPVDSPLFSSGPLVCYKEKALRVLLKLSKWDLRLLESISLAFLATSTSNVTTYRFLLATGAISIALEAIRFSFMKKKLLYPTLDKVKWSKLFSKIIRSLQADATFLFEAEVGATREITNNIQFAMDLLTLVNQDDSSPWKTLDLDGSRERDFFRCLENSTATPQLVAAMQHWRSHVAYLNEGIREVAFLRLSLSESGPIGKELKAALSKIRSAATFRKEASESITGRTLASLLLFGLSANSDYFFGELTRVSTNPYNNLHTKMSSSVRYLEIFIDVAQFLRGILESEYTDLQLAEDFGDSNVKAERTVRRRASARTITSVHVGQAINYARQFIIDAYDRRNHLTYVLEVLNRYNDDMIRAPTREPKNWEEVIENFNEASEKLEDLFEMIDWALKPWNDARVDESGSSNIPSHNRN